MYRKLLNQLYEELTKIGFYNFTELRRSRGENISFKADHEGKEELKTYKRQVKQWERQNEYIRKVIVHEKQERMTGITVKLTKSAYNWRGGDK